MIIRYNFLVSLSVLCQGFLSLLVATSCIQQENDAKISQGFQKQKLFSAISSKQSGITFTNKLVESVESNYYQYMYTYLGGGVAAGDLNMDGLEDLYFTSNSGQDRLYLNKGDFRFEDITAHAGIKYNQGFHTGVTMVDIDQDGDLDIYVSRGGWKSENNKFANLLYVNNGDLSFTERAEEFGLADENRTIQATFFDYDQDNDLDVYISNTPNITSRTQVLDLDQIQKDPKTLELLGSDRLYNNDGAGHFIDVSQKAGLQFDIGFGLNPQVGDLNNDGWLDVYVCNDFNGPDLVYVNQGDGTFLESRNKLFKHMSFNSMGGDMADIDNDGLLDLVTLDMNPENYIRSKTTMGMTSIDQFELMVDKGYHYQYMHNMLQLNNGNGTFSEIGLMSGIARTDWSWAVLLADFDLDGYNDLYVTNGVYRDVIDRDRNNEILQMLRANQRKPTPEDFLKFTKMLPQQKLNNYFYKNKGDLTFDDTSLIWSDSLLTFSNGAVYADLDNDGDLDIVTNNINDKATILRNNASDRDQGNHLRIAFIGHKKNRFGVGAIVTILLPNGTKQTRQLVNTRGFLSSVSNKLHFGLGRNDTIEKVEIRWPDGKHQELFNIASDQLLQIDYADASQFVDGSKKGTASKPIFSKLISDFYHKDPYFNDYSHQLLLPHKLSQTGPAMAKSDINNDGLQDVFLGGGHQQEGQLLLGQNSGIFKPITTGAFVVDKRFEDVGACFFDADNDGDQDLYVVSGSYEFDRNPKLLLDRLYLNNGRGVFTKSVNGLPNVISAGSVVKPFDYDQDGDIDLFVGGRVIPGRYPYAPISYLLTNDNGSFIIATPQLAPELENVGMVTDAVWTDMNGDGNVDLIVTGEWMGIEVFINQNNSLVKSKAYSELSSTTGWWNRLMVVDTDNDGDQDIVAGNLGLNYKFHASETKPFHVYTKDFDRNGVEDIILAKYYGDQQVPVRGKGCMSQQLPHLEQKIPTYTDFANRDLSGILGPDLESALHYQVTEFRSGIFLNNGAGSYSFSPFMLKVQQSPVNSIVHDDFDGDGINDLILAGNNYQSEVETTRADAGTGSFLKGDGYGNYVRQSNLQSGFFADKDVRNIISIDIPDGKILFVVNNDSNHDLFKVNKL